MVDTGFTSPGTVINVDVAPFGPWVSTVLAKISDDQWTLCQINKNGSSDILRSTDFDPAIDTNATILGIELEVEGHMDAADVTDMVIRLRKGGAQVGDNKSSGVDWSFPTDAIRSYGDATDLWGTTWTPAEVNASDFGIDLRLINNVGVTRNTSVDHVRIKFYYILPGPIKLETTATGIPVFTESSLSWEHFLEGPLGDGRELMVFIGAIDSQSPSIISATLSGTALTPAASQDFTEIASAVGPGGQAFPTAYILGLADPVVATGTITGTITVEFDETVSNMNGISAYFINVDTADPFTSTVEGVTTNPIHPNFDIAVDFTSTVSGHVVIDLCVAQSSNHNDHTPGIDQIKFADFNMNGPRFTATRKTITASGTTEITRSGVGGEFAGVSLIAVELNNL